MIKGVIILLIIIVLYWNADNIRFQIEASAIPTALKSMISIILLFIAILLIINYLEVEHICVLGY